MQAETEALTQLLEVAGTIPHRHCSCLEPCTQAEEKDAEASEAKRLRTEAGGRLSALAISKLARIKLGTKRSGQEYQPPQPPFPHIILSAQLQAVYALMTSCTTCIWPHVHCLIPALPVASTAQIRCPVRRTCRHCWSWHEICGFQLHMVCTVLSAMLKRSRNVLLSKTCCND